MVDEKTYHLINDYLNGDLQGTTLDIFKSRLNSEKGLRRAVSEQKAIIAALNTVREQELRDILKSDNKKKKVIAIGPYLKTAGLAAAAIAILVVAFFSIRPYITDSADTNTAQESKAKPQQTLEKPEPITEDSNLIADNPRQIMKDLSWDFNVFYDEKDAVGKRYRRQDAAGTPFCITVDHETLENNTVTIRHRDTMKQERVNISEATHISKFCSDYH